MYGYLAPIFIIKIYLMVKGKVFNSKIVKYPKAHIAGI